LLGIKKNIEERAKRASDEGLSFALSHEPNVEPEAYEKL